MLPEDEPHPTRMRAGLRRPRGPKSNAGRARLRRFASGGFSRLVSDSDVSRAEISPEYAARVGRRGDRRARLRSGAAAGSNGVRVVASRAAARADPDGRADPARQPARHGGARLFQGPPAATSATKKTSCRLESRAAADIGARCSKLGLSRIFLGYEACPRRKKLGRWLQRT